VRDKILCPYKIEGKIIFMYILFFIFETANRELKCILERRRKYERIKRKGGRCKDRRVLSVYLLAGRYEALVNYRRNTFPGCCNFEYNLKTEELCTTSIRVSINGYAFSKVS